MKVTMKLFSAVLFGLSTAALAGHGGAQVSCEVQDAKGQTLADSRASVERVPGQSANISAEGAFFRYRVKLEGETALAELVDTRSGDKVYLEEGELSPGEKIVVGLVTDEAPNAPIKLICQADKT